MHPKTLQKIEKNTYRARKSIAKLIRLYEHDNVLSSSELDNLGDMSNNLLFMLNDITPDYTVRECITCMKETEHMMTYSSKAFKSGYECRVCWEYESS